VYAKCYAAACQHLLKCVNTQSKAVAVADRHSLFSVTTDKWCCCWWWWWWRRQATVILPVSHGDKQISRNRFHIDESVVSSYYSVHACELASKNSKVLNSVHCV